MVHFRSLLVVLAPPKNFHVALNSFRKHSSNVSPAALHFVAITSYDYMYGQDFRFNHNTKCKEADKTFKQPFLKEFKATYKESKLKQQKVISIATYVACAPSLSI